MQNSLLPDFSELADAKIVINPAERKVCLKLCFCKF